jgi:hypothetical protein
MASALAKYPKVKDGETILLPRNAPYGMACCDCSLVHDLHVKADDRGRITLQAFRNEKETKALRDERQFVRDAKRKKPKNGDDDPDNDTEVEDGQSVHVGLMDGTALQRAIAAYDAQLRRPATPTPVVDTAFHVPGYVNIDTREVRDAREKARQARQELIDRTTNAWRSPNNPPLPRPPTFHDANQMRREARDSYIARTTSAWRNIPNPSASRDADPGMSFHRVSPQEFAAAYNAPPRQSPEAMREASYNERTRQLTQAWKNPPNAFAAANAVEAMRRQTTNE